MRVRWLRLPRCSIQAAPLLAVALIACIAAASAAAASQPGPTRNSIAGGCYRLEASSGFVTKAGEGYAASASASEAEPFRMQAIDLGQYLLYGREGDFLATGSGDSVEVAAEPSPVAEWLVRERGGGFTLVNAASGRGLAVGADAALVQGEPATFAMVRSGGCAKYPEIAVNARGTPARGETPYGKAAGYVDMHIHTMFFEAVGGRIHCGRPWHPYGVAYALPDCAEQEGPGGVAAPVQNFLNWGSPVYSYDTRGWPTFKDWPNHHSLTFEQVYYKWIERAWMGGLRLMTILAVDNAALCKAYPFKVHPCNEMQSIRREIRDIYELQDYIDAQSGGPGKGWFRVVRNPFQARRVINRGKLAIVIGIETSVLFDCGVYKDEPQCDRGQVKRGLEEVHELGVRQMELINKFDNAFAGVTGDAGFFGVVTNTGNFSETGSFFAFERCTGHAHDQPALTGVQTDIGIGFVPLIQPGTLPVYPPPPHCNVRGLTNLGRQLVKGMMQRGMLIDPDHLSVRAREGLLTMVKAARYSGIISSHSWSDELTYPKIYDGRGFITPYAGGSEDFADQWRVLRKERNPRYPFGFGYGSDMNGFGAQGPPREGENPVRYPFESFDGGVTLDRQRSGERTFDINSDGVAHYGLYPDWIEDLRMIAGNRIVKDLARGAESYLEVWERAVGVPDRRCRPKHARLTASGLGRLHLGDSPVRMLKRAGQPEERDGHVYRYCVAGRRNGDAEVAAVFGAGGAGMIVSDANGHKAGGVAVGDSADDVEGAARRGKTLTVKGPRGARYVYRTSNGAVRAVGVASRSTKIKRALRLAR